MCSPIIKNRNGFSDTLHFLEIKLCIKDSFPGFPAQKQLSPRRDDHRMTIELIIRILTDTIDRHDIALILNGSRLKQ